MGDPDDKNLTKRENDSPIERHWPEISLAAVGVLVSVVGGIKFLDKNTAFLFGCTSAFSAMIIALIKHYVAIQIRREIDPMTAQIRDTGFNNTRFGTISEKLSKFDGLAARAAQKELSDFESALVDIEYGRFSLSEAEYYDDIISMMRGSNASSEVHATSCFDERRWDQDERQLNYLVAQEEALEKKAILNRIFIIGKEKLSHPDYRASFESIDRQIHDDRINAYVVWKETLRGNPDLIEDWVMFGPGEAVVYQAFTDPSRISSYRVRKALKLIGNDEKSEKYASIYRGQFNKLLNFKIRPQEFRKALEADVTKICDDLLALPAPIAAPGPALPVFDLGHEVVSCEEAAAAKGIPLSRELKTLVARSAIGTICLHIPGNERASWDLVDKALAVKGRASRMLDRAELLEEFDKRPGTVSPVFETLWSTTTHLIDEKVFRNTTVSTNNGTLTKYVFFIPELLRQSPNNMIGRFCETDKEKS